MSNQLRVTSGCCLFTADELTTSCPFSCLSKAHWRPSMPSVLKHFLSSFASVKQVNWWNWLADFFCLIQYLKWYPLSEQEDFTKKRSNVDKSYPQVEVVAEPNALMINLGADLYDLCIYLWLSVLINIKSTERQEQQNTTDHQDSAKLEGFFCRGGFYGCGWLNSGQSTAGLIFCQPRQRALTK